jgi:hypothetical protein
MKLDFKKISCSKSLSFAGIIPQCNNARLVGTNIPLSLFPYFDPNERSMKNDIQSAGVQTQDFSVSRYNH